MKSHADIIEVLRKQKKSLTQIQIEELIQLVKKREIINSKISKKDQDVQALKISFSFAVFNTKIFIIGPGEKQKALIGQSDSRKIKLMLCITEESVRALKIIPIEGKKARTRLQRRMRSINEANLNIQRKSSFGFFNYQPSEYHLEKFFIDLDYLPEGDLQQCIQYLNSKGLIETFFNRLILAQAIVKEIEDFYLSGYLHRDLKPANLMLVPNGVKLIDFGLATKKDTPEKGVCGTDGYIAPELFKDESSDFNEKTEVYATGGILLKLFNFAKDFSEQNSRVKYFELNEDWIRKTDDKEYLIELLEEIEKIYHPDPSQRPTFAEIKKILTQKIKQCPTTLQKKSADLSSSLEISFFANEENFPTLPHDASEGKIEIELTSENLHQN